MPTIVDVAREAGVGLGTVSRVINGKGAISEESRLAVEKAMKRLGYRPSSLAKRRGRRGPSHGLRLRVASGGGGNGMDWPGYLLTVQAMRKACESEGLAWIEEDEEAPAFPTVTAVLGAQAGEVPSFADASPLLWVLGWPGPLAPGDRILADHAAIGALAARILDDEAKGGRNEDPRIGLTWGAGQLAERARAFAEASGGEVLDLKGKTTPAFASAVERIVTVSKRSRPALFAADDEIAWAVIESLSAKGLSFGKDYALVGVNAEGPVRGERRTDFPSIDPRAEAVGSRAVEAALRRLRMPKAPFEEIRVSPAFAGKTSP